MIKIDFMGREFIVLGNIEHRRLGPGIGLHVMSICVYSELLSIYCILYTAYLVSILYCPSTVYQVPIFCTSTRYSLSIYCLSTCVY